MLTEYLKTSFTLCIRKEINDVENMWKLGESSLFIQQN